jgi:hypothetical protein
MEIFDSAEVTLADEGFSGFQLNFLIGRNKSTGRTDYTTLTSSLFKPQNRVIIFVRFGTLPHVLMDGIVTNHQFNPGSKPGMGMLTVTGLDLTAKMNMEQYNTQYVSQNEVTIVNSILGKYSGDGIVPKVVAPDTLETYPASKYTQTQHGSDYEYVLELAERFNHKFYLKPGPTPGVSTAYWGPPVRTGTPQPAISVNMRQGSNATSVNFSNDALGPTSIVNEFQEWGTEKKKTIKAKSSTLDPISGSPLELKRKSFMREPDILSHAQALAKGDAMVNESVEKGIEASGEIDGFRYRHALMAGELVYLRGVGESYDGIYYVQNVTHTLRKGEYKQRFTLNREGIQTTTGKVTT